MSARILLSVNQAAVTNPSPCQPEVAFDWAATLARFVSRWLSMLSGRTATSARPW